MDKIKIASVNLNGIRSAIRKEFSDWVYTTEPDIICVQETKAQIEKLDPSEYTLNGYHFIHKSAEKPGYSGVGIYSKSQPTDVIKQCGLSWADAEGRYIQCKINNLEIASIYLPSGTSGDQRQTLKYEMLDFYYQHLLKTNIEQPIIYCGDFNIAHTPLDIKRDKANEKNSGYLPDERQWIQDVLDLGYIDTFRTLHPDTEQFTWWTYRAGARQKNIGWRIDYQLAGHIFKDRLIDAVVISEPVFSDHAILMHTYRL
ncbi:exodeoxyribonuclease III [Gammaproteobacteria bacterium]|nr:exodeoxyribonuclease III [Gammaproteobacteria bacterium]